MVGGGAEDEPVDDGEGTGGSGGPGAGGGGAAPAPNVPVRPSDVGTVLPACEPGFERDRAGGRDCIYVLGSTCYEDERVACACACRGLASSACIIDGFLDPDAPQQVRCAAR